MAGDTPNARPAKSSCHPPLPRVRAPPGCGEAAFQGCSLSLWQECKAVFYECSAMTGYNVLQPMLHMARSVNRNSPTPIHTLGYFPGWR